MTENKATQERTPQERLQEEQEQGTCSSYEN